jgi:hypothetical protein
MVEKEMKVVIVKNGPYLVSGGLPLEKEISICGSENQPEKWEKGKNIRSKKIMRYADVENQKINHSVTVHI